MTDAQRRLWLTLKRIPGAHIRSGMFGPSLYVEDCFCRNLRAATVRALAKKGRLRKRHDKNAWEAL